MAKESKLLACYKFIEELTAVIQKIRKHDVNQRHWKDATMEVRFRGKGLKDDCKNIHGIYLLAATDKGLSRIMLDRIQIYVTNEIRSESQSGLKNSNVTIVMIFSAQQLQEKLQNSK